MTKRAHQEVETPDVILGIDIGGTKTALLAISRATGRTLASDSISTPRRPSAPAFVALLRRVSNTTLARVGERARKPYEPWAARCPARSTNAV